MYGLYFLILVGLFVPNSGEFSIDLPSLPSWKEIFDVDEIQAGLCLMPEDVKDFFMGLTIKDIYKFITLTPQLTELAQNDTDSSMTQAENLIKTEAPELYAKIDTVLQKYKAKYNQLPEGSKTFLNNLATNMEKFKDYEEYKEAKFDEVHKFFVDLNENYTKLGEAEKNALVNFFSSMSHIIGKPEFTMLLKDSANARDNEELEQAGKKFGDFVLQHACDQENAKPDAVTRAKRYLEFFKF